MHFIVFDCETTGIEPGSRLVELAALKVNDRGEVVETFQRLINPGMPIPADVTAVHGITQEMLAEAGDTLQALTDFLAFVEGAAFAVAHNAAFDVGIIGHALDSHGMKHPTMPVVDTCAMAKAIKETSNNKLGTLVEHYGIKVGDLHRAVADAEACRLYYALASQKVQPEAKPWFAQVQYLAPEALPSHLAGLPEAVRAGSPIAFTYTDAKGQRTSRKVTPYGWAKTSTGISFHGLCHEKQERRTFLAERVGL